jgi:cytochrome c oxidase assembly factor CtaG/putative copper export protein
MIEILSPLSKGLMQLMALSSIGLLIALAVLAIEVKGKITNVKLAVRSKKFLFAWLLSLFLFIIVQISYLLEQPLRNSLNPTVLRSYLTQTAIGKSYLIQIIIICLVLLIPMRRIGAAYIGSLLSMVAIASPVFQSHGSSSGHHGLAIGALVIHVIALSLWVGGLIGLAQLNKDEQKIALPRFSEIALWSAIAVALSGVATAWTRLDSIQSWQSKYGAIVILKVFLTFILIGFGALHRRWLINKDYPSIFRLIIGEIAVMATTVFVGSWLSTTAPPVKNIEISQSLLITGLEMPKPPTVGRVLLAYDPDGLMIGLLILAVALYIKGVLVLTRRGDKWPVGRTIAFALGISAIDFATSGGLGVYARFAFSNHMLAHMVLGMIAPIGIVLGAPITLALRTLPAGRNKDERGIRGSFISLLHSKFGKLSANPIVALAIFDGSLFLLYFTPLFSNLMVGHSGHFFMNIHFILAGFLFFQAIIGIDPMPVRIPHIVKIVILFAAMSIHAFFSIALMSATTLLDNGYFASLERPWATDLLADQNLGGAIGWAMGEIPILLALVATFIQWIREDKKESGRIDRASDRAAAMGEDDELAQYNRYLANLNRRDNSD